MKQNRLQTTAFSAQDLNAFQVLLWDNSWLLLSLASISLDQILEWELCESKDFVLLFDVPLASETVADTQ